MILSPGSAVAEPGVVFRPKLYFFIEEKYFNNHLIRDFHKKYFNDYLIQEIQEKYILLYHMS